MQSQTTEEFRALLAAAPPAIQAKAQSIYRLWSENPSHPSLRFKKVHDKLPIYSVRIDLNWRALGVLPGASTLEVEITNVSKHGFWLLLGDEELFVPFSGFPRFKDASVAKLTNVENSHPDHLYWPDLDVDLAVESIRHPERFPLIAGSNN